MSLRATLPTLLLVLAGIPVSSSAREIPYNRASPDVDLNYDGAMALAAGDLNGDGITDLVGAAEDSLEIVWWDGFVTSMTFDFGTPDTIQGALSTGPKDVLVADIDGDGDLDVVAASEGDDEIAWWANNGSATVWTKTTITTVGSNHRGLAVADIDRDGTLDVLGAIGDNLGWFSNDNGDGSVWTPASIAASFGGARAMAVGDLDGDGDPDVAAVAETDGDVAWFENPATGAWTRHDLDVTFGGARDVAVADVDGDGDLDVAAVAAGDNDLVWWELPAETAHNVDLDFPGAASLAAADLDADGDVDLAAGGAGGVAPFEHVAWFENTGGGATWQQRTVDGAFDTAYAVLAHDLDSDGDLDLAAVYQALNKACHDAVFISLPLAPHGVWYRAWTDPALAAGATRRSTASAGCAVELPTLYAPSWATVVDFLDRHLK